MYAEPNVPDVPASPSGGEASSEVSSGSGSDSPSHGEESSPTVPVLEVSPSSLDFGSSTALLSLELRCLGTGTLSYSIRSEAPWASVSPAAGVLGSEPITIVVAVKRAELEPGSYVGALVIDTTNGQSRRVEVRLQVLAVPVLHYEPSELDFGPEARTLAFSLRNAGNGTLTYTVLPQEDWITVEPDSGDLTTESDTIEVTVHRGSLVVGPHTGYLRIVSSTGVDAAIPVLATKPLTDPLLIPWVEANLADEAEIERVVEGMQIWRRVTDTVLVTTGYRNADLYRTLRARVPDMHVIPSIKTSYWLVTRFDSPSAWEALAGHVQAFLDAAGESRIVFEHETALAPYWAGTYDMNFDDLARGLAFLPPDVEYGWYPGLVYSHTNPDLLPRSLALAQAVQPALSTEGRRVRFVDLSYDDPAWPVYPPAMQARAALESFANQTPLTLAYVGCFNGYCYWSTARIREVMEQVRPRPDLLVYPGSTRWVSTATAIADELSEP